MSKNVGDRATRESEAICPFTGIALKSSMKFERNLRSFEMQNEIGFYGARFVLIADRSVAKVSRPSNHLVSW